MKKAVLFLCVVLIAFTGCSNESMVDYMDVEDRMKAEGLEVTESRDQKIANLAISLQNQSPKIYQLDDSNYVYLYVFDSVDERKKANKEYGEKMNNSELTTQVSFQNKNIIAFYVYTNDRSENLEDKVEKVIENL